ncbi:MAG TPA: histidine phosphatase family protein [Gaiellaceae bacterium]
MTIYLVRHGETIWNRGGREQGHLDSPLTARGIAQANAIGQLLRNLLPEGEALSIETSPLGRARETASIVLSEIAADVRAVIIEPLLIERDLGLWQGLTLAEVEERYPGSQAERNVDKWNYVIPNGESYAQTAVRAKKWLEIRRDTSARIAVTHEMLSRTIQGAYADMTPAQTLARCHSHDRVYRLQDGRIEVLRS